MLWLLGVVAILVDVVSRFSGNKVAMHPDPVKVVIHSTTTTLPPVKIDRSSPDIEVTYFSINDKNVPSIPSGDNDDPDTPPEPERNHDNKRKPINNGGNGLSGNPPLNMEPSDTQIENNNANNGDGDEEPKNPQGVHKLG